jgi:hypothetical protein
MKDTLFPPKQVTFDPVVIEKTVITEKTIGTDSDYYLYPSKHLQGQNLDIPLLYEMKGLGIIEIMFSVYIKVIY